MMNQYLAISIQNSHRLRSNYHFVLYRGGQRGFEPCRKLLSGAEENPTTGRCQDEVFNETSHHPS